MPSHPPGPPNGRPINASLTPVDGKKERYFFDFPLRPGETQFEVAYDMPYSGQATLHRTLLHDVQHFVAMVPKSMKFIAASGARFSPMPDQSGTDVEVMTNAKAGETPSFTVSGTGMMVEDDGAGDASPEVATAPSRAGPGGGLGKPIDSPDPLSHYRWPILGLLAVVLVSGGFAIARRTPPSAASAPPGILEPNSPGSATSLPTLEQTSPAPGNMLAAIKEELFQLEVERQQGRITDEEYTRTKAALDLTLRRALSRLGNSR